MPQYYCFFWFWFCFFQKQEEELRWSCRSFPTSTILWIYDCLYSPVGPTVPEHCPTTAFWLQSVGRAHRHHHSISSFTPRRIRNTPLPLACGGSSRLNQEAVSPRWDSHQGVVQVPPSSHSEVASCFTSWLHEQHPSFSQVSNPRHRNPRLFPRGSLWDFA